MNHTTHLNRLMNLLQLYKDFMPFCKGHEVIKLTTEIYKIAEKIDKINNLKTYELRTDVPLYTEQFESKMNYLNS